MKPSICMRGILVLGLGLLGPGGSFAAGKGTKEVPLTGPVLKAQVQESGYVRIFDGSKRVATFMPQLFLKNWNMIFFESPEKDGGVDAVAKLPDGGKVSYKVSLKMGPEGLKVHCVMVPSVDFQGLSVRQVVFFPFEDWDGATYDFGVRKAQIGHEVVMASGGTIAQDTAPLILGPTLKGGMTAKLTTALETHLMDNRQWTPDLNVFFSRPKEAGGALFDWKAGEEKAFDFTLSLNRKVVVAPEVPPKDLEVLKARIDSMVQPLIEGGFCPGLAVGVLYQGKTQVWGYGRTNLKDGKLPDGDTEYEIGSITKLFTKLLFSDMVHQGKMGLGDKVQSYLPKGVTMPVKDGKEITLLMLSNHTSGLPSFPDDGHMDQPNPYGEYSLEKLYKFLSGYKLEETPGAKYKYSNTGVGLLGCLVAEKNGSTWEGYLQKRILDPVGMKDTGVVWTKDELSRAAMGYDGGMAELGFWKWGNSAYLPAGSLHSTVNDLLKLGKVALDKESSPLSDIAFDDIAQKLDWGPQPQHDGATYGFNSSFFVDREKGTVLVMLGNMGGNGLTSEVAWRAKNLLKGGMVEEFEHPVFTQLPASDLKKYTGKYKVEQFPPSWGKIPKEEITCYLKDGVLYAKAKWWARDLRIDPLVNGNFYVKQQRFELIFTKDAKGNITGYKGKDNPTYIVKKTDYKDPNPKPGDDIPDPR